MWIFPLMHHVNWPLPTALWSVCRIGMKHLRIMNGAFIEVKLCVNKLDRCLCRKDAEYSCYGIFCKSWKRHHFGFISFINLLINSVCFFRSCLPPGWMAGILLLGGVTQSSMSPFFAACDAYSSKWHSYFWLFERSGNCWTVSVLWKTKTAVDFSGTNTVPLYTCMCLQLLMDILMNDLDTKNKGMHFYRPYISQRAMYLLLRDCNR